MKLRIGWRQHIKKLYLVAAVVSFCVGGLIAFVGNETSNPFLILLGFGGLAGGIMLFRTWKRQGDIRYTGKKKEKLAGPPPNSLNISLNEIEFVYEENPLGQSQKCLNDSKYYHVHKVMLGEKEEFRLPDDDESERYYDPGEFANPVTMRSNKQYFNWSASTLQKISVGAMTLIIGAEIIGLIVVGG